MKIYKKILIAFLGIFVFLCISANIILMMIIVISHFGMRSNYETLTSEFMPIFSDINEEFDNMFSYEDARYSGGGGTKNYYLSYLGEDTDFLENSLAFYNTFCEYVKSGKYDEYSLGYEIRIKINGEYLYLNCWYNYIKDDKISMRAATNVICDYTIFQELNGIRKLTIVTRRYTEEQKEYAESFVDQCPFEIFISDEVPW